MIKGVSRVWKKLYKSIRIKPNYSGENKAKDVTRHFTEEEDRKTN